MALITDEEASSVFEESPSLELLTPGLSRKVYGDLYSFYGPYILFATKFWWKKPFEYMVGRGGGGVNSRSKRDQNYEKKIQQDEKPERLRTAGLEHAFTFHSIPVRFKIRLESVLIQVNRHVYG